MGVVVQFIPTLVCSIAHTRSCLGSLTRFQAPEPPSVAGIRLEGRFVFCSLSLMCFFGKAEGLSAPCFSHRHQQWFYLKNDIEAPLPKFTGCLIEVQPESWNWGILKNLMKRVEEPVAAVRFLRNHDIKGGGVIGAYHARRVAQLMERKLPLFKMVAGASLEGMVLVEGGLPNSEIAQRIKDALGVVKESVGAFLDFVYLILRHPPMRPNRGFLELVSPFLPQSFFALSPDFCSPDLKRADGSRGTTSSRILQLRCRRTRP